MVRNDKYRALALWDVLVCVVSKLQLFLGVCLACSCSFDFAFLDADKRSYYNYYRLLMKLVRVLPSCMSRPSLGDEGCVCTR